MAICPHCDRDCGPGANLARHVVFCKKLPSIEVLVAAKDNGATWNGLARKYNVARSTLQRRMKDTLQPREYESKPKMEDYPYYAPFLGSACRRCPVDNKFCHQLQRAMGFVLCEAPTAEDIDIWLAMRFDVEEFIRRLQFPRMYEWMEHEEGTYV